jgi:hypothetical protein
MVPVVQIFIRAQLFSPSPLCISGDGPSMRDSFILTNSILASILRCTSENETAEKGAAKGQPQVRGPGFFTCR